MNTYDLYVDLLKQFIQLPSISTDSSYKAGCEMAANWLSELFQDHGLSSELINGYGNPIVLAHYIQDESLPTALIYGHYDVQPAKKEEGWDTDPFVVEERNGKLFARGIADNKGQIMLHIASLFSLIQEDAMINHNVTFLLEGNEETGSTLMSKFIKDYKESIQCDVVLISDSELMNEKPNLIAGFRGGINTQITIKTADVDVHSGAFGGAVPSSSHLLIDFLARLYNTDRTIAIPGFYDGAHIPTASEIAQCDAIPFTLEHLKKNTGIRAITAEAGYNPNTQVGLRPTLQVTSIQAGYIGEGFRNAIPAESCAKINWRLVEGQDPDVILTKLKQFIEDFLPDYAEYELEFLQKYKAVKFDIDNAYIEKAKKLLETIFDDEVYIKYEGAGIPITVSIKELLGVPQILAGFANEDCNMHGVNENFDIELIKKGLEFSKQFFEA